MACNESANGGNGKEAKQLVQVRFQSHFEGNLYTEGIHLYKIKTGK